MCAKNYTGDIPILKKIFIYLKLHWASCIFSASPFSLIFGWREVRQRGGDNKAVAKGTVRHYSLCFLSSLLN